MLQQNPTFKDHNRLNGTAEFYSNEQVDFRASNLKDAETYSEIKRAMGEVANAFKTVEAEAIQQPSSISREAISGVNIDKHNQLTPELTLIVGNALKQFRKLEMQKKDDSDATPSDRNKSDFQLTT